MRPKHKLPFAHRWITLMPSGINWDFKEITRHLCFFLLMPWYHARFYNQLCLLSCEILTTALNTWALCGGCSWSWEYQACCTCCSVMSLWPEVRMFSQHFLLTRNVKRRKNAEVKPQTLWRWHLELWRCLLSLLASRWLRIPELGLEREANGETPESTCVTKVNMQYEKINKGI